MFSASLKDDEHNTPRALANNNFFHETVKVLETEPLVLESQRVHQRKVLICKTSEPYLDTPTRNPQARTSLPELTTK
eukprot:1932496-Amphidinium_carterae.1